MSDVVYRPGEWQVVVEESGIAALPADASADKVVALSNMLSRRVPELTEAIDVLSGGAITGLGSFAVALIGPNGTRFAVRGAVTVTTGVDESFSGEDITTWSERFIPGQARFEMGFGDAGEATPYPIRSGVVLASGIRIGDPFEAPAEEDEADAAVQDGAGLVAASAADEAQPVEDESDDQVETETETETESETGTDSEALAPLPDSGAAEAGDAADVSPLPAEESGADGTEAVQSDTIRPDEIPPAAGSVDEVPTETITPDDVVLARGEDAGEAAAHDLGATIAPPVTTPPAPVADPWAVTPPPAPGLDIGDHDGSTISLAEARRLRGATSGPDAPTEVMPAVTGDPADGSMVRIRLSTGQVVDLDRPVVIGRKPRSTRASGASLPHLIAVESPSSDISRNHLEVRPEGDSVVVIDLHTTNGSTLLRSGADPVRLHPGEQTLVLGGDVIDIGDGVTVTVEEAR